MSRHSLVFVALLVARGALGAQAVGETPDCVKLFDRPATQLDSLHVEVELNYQLAGVPLASAERLAADIGGAIEFPTPFAIPPVVTIWLEGDTITGVRRAAQAFRVEAMVQLDKKGVATRTMITETSLVPSIDSALLAATDAILAIGLPDEIVRGARHAHGGALFVRLLLSPATGKAPGPSVDRIAEVGLAALRVPLFEGVAKPRYAKPPRAPAYPFEMQQQGIDGRAVFTFVISPGGLIAPGTFTLSSATGRQFAQAALRSFKDARFLPATIDGCPVAALTSQPFTFQIGR